MRNVNFAATFLIPVFITSVGMAQDRPGTETSQPEVGIAKRGTFDVLYSAKGEAECAEKAEIKCQTTGVVLAMVPEGSNVKPGDWLVTLSSTEQQNLVDAQRIAVFQAETELISAEAREQSASAAIMEYLQGTYEEQKHALQREINVAERNLELNQEEYQAAENAGITKLELNRLAMKLEESTNELELLKMRLKVLQDITKAKRTVELENDIKAARLALNNARDILEIHHKRLKDAEEQIAACTILAPEGVNGEVYFSQSRTADRRVNPIGIGSQIHEGQTIAHIPASPEMNVNVFLPQAEAVRVQRGMRAKIRIFDKTYYGYVISLATLRSRPGPSGNIRGLIGICTVKVIDPPYFKPGMSTDVTIKLDEVRDQIYLPVHSILNHDGEDYCCIQKPDSTYETRKLETGGDNGRFVAIKSGISEGDRYLLGPGDWPQFLDLPSVIDPSLDEEFDFPIPTVGQPNDEGQRSRAGVIGPSMSAMSSMVDGMMSRYDTNGDGKIDKGEQAGLTERVRGMMEKADSDGDGTVNKEEITAMLKRFQIGGGGGQSKKPDNKNDRL